MHKYNYYKRMAGGNYLRIGVVHSDTWADACCHVERAYWGERVYIDTINIESKEYERNVIVGAWNT